MAVLPSETNSGLWSETSVIGGLLALPTPTCGNVDEIRLDEPVGMVNRIFIISTGAPTQIFTVPKGNCSYNLQPILFRCSVGVLLYGGR